MTGNTELLKEWPTTTVSLVRNMIFQASKSPVEIRKEDANWIETSFGRCRVSGKLGQRHAGFIELAMYHSEVRRPISDGGFELLVDPAKIRKSMSEKYYSYEALMNLKDDCMNAYIEIETEKLVAEGRLIDHIIRSNAKRPNPLFAAQKNSLDKHSLLKPERHLWKVRLGALFSRLIHKELKLFYNPELIIPMKNGISQAISRHALSHSVVPQGGWYLDTLIKAVSPVPPTGDKIRRLRAECREDTQSMRAAGLDLQNDRVKKL